MIQSGMLLCGRFRVLFLYDVAESIDLEKLRSLLGSRGGRAEPTFPRRTPEYVRFEQTPVVEPGEFVSVRGVKAPCPVKYYGFGVIVIPVEVPFEADWQSLPEQGARWMEAPDLERLVREMVRNRITEIQPSVIKPTEEMLQESYLITEINEIRTNDGKQPLAAELLLNYGDELVQLLRGETAPVSPKAREESLNLSLSYYPSDLVLAASHGAIVYDRPEEALAAAQVLEYAKMQLLEFRYYDRFMSRVLAAVYSALERKRNVLLSRWSLPREAQRFNTIRLDVMELTERIDNAIKFVSDIYYARVYQVASARMGVPDYRKLVEEKLHTVGELYDFMVDQFNETRSFVLELLITILAILDVIFLFRGK